jgi:hypothetical protein
MLENPPGGGCGGLDNGMDEDGGGANGRGPAAGGGCIEGAIGRGANCVGPGAEGI